MKFLVCGSREGFNEQKVRALIATCLTEFNPSTDVLIHGDARGVDTIARELWEQRGGIAIPYKPRYSKYGRFFAPKARNTEMLTDNPDLVKVLAFTTGSGGTADMIGKSRDAKVETKVYVI